MKKYTPQELIEISNTAGGGGVKFEPGTDWEYCNTNYILLGMIIEEVTQKPYHEEVENRIVLPLGLSHTFAPTDEEVDMPTPCAHGYAFLEDSNDAWQDMTVQNMSKAWAAGNIISTVRDMGTWIDALCSGDLLSEPYLSEMFQWVSTGVNDEFQYYGLGVLKYNGAIGHSGSVPGYRSCILKYKDYSFVVLLNGYETVTPYENHHALYVFSKAAEALGLS